jgi:hypothetical protein
MSEELARLEALEARLTAIEARQAAIEARLTTQARKAAQARQETADRIASLKPKPARVPRHRPELSPERQAVLNVLKEQPGLKIDDVNRILNRVKKGTARLMSDMKAASLLRSLHGAWYVVEEAPAEE